MLMESILVVALFSRHMPAFDWARDRIASEWGPISLESPLFDFCDTDYYLPSMGAGIRKGFLAVEGIFDAAELASRKRQAIQWEEECRADGGYPDIRPINMDPGYLNLSKLVLASTKERAHRVYLNQGIFGEVTMRYVGGWQFYPWTYPDYQRPESLKFFSSCRELFRASRSKSKT